jgi:hypothetical protein
MFKYRSGSGKKKKKKYPDPIDSGSTILLYLFPLSRETHASLLGNGAVKSDCSVVELLVFADG